MLERNKDTRREKKRKTIIYQKYVHAEDKKIKKYKNEEIRKNTIIHQKLIRGISQEYSSSY